MRRRPSSGRHPKPYPKAAVAAGLPDVGLPPDSGGMADIPQPRGLGPETGIRPFAVSSIGGSLPKAAEAEVPITTEPSVQSAQATTLSAAPASEQEAIRAVLNSYYDAFGRDA